MFFLLYINCRGYVARNKELYENYELFVLKGWEDMILDICKVLSQFFMESLRKSMKTGYPNP